MGRNRFSHPAKVPYLCSFYCLPACPSPVYLPIIVCLLDLPVCFPVYIIHLYCLLSSLLVVCVLACQTLMFLCVSLLARQNVCMVFWCIVVHPGCCHYYLAYCYEICHSQSSCLFWPTVLFTSACLLDPTCLLLFVLAFVPVCLSLPTYPHFLTYNSLSLCVLSVRVYFFTPAYLVAPFLPTCLPALIIITSILASAVEVVVSLFVSNT